MEQGLQPYGTKAVTVWALALDRQYREVLAHAPRMALRARGELARAGVASPASLSASLAMPLDLLVSIVEAPLGSAPARPPVPLQRAPGGSARLGTSRVRPGHHWTARQRLEGSRQLPLKSPLSLALSV